MYIGSSPIVPPNAKGSNHVHTCTLANKTIVTKIIFLGGVMGDEYAHSKQCAIYSSTPNSPHTLYLLLSPTPLEAQYICLQEESYSKS